MASLFVRKTVWINSRLQKNFIAWVQHTLLPKQIVKIINWSQLSKVHILLICVAFLENMNFNNTLYIHSIFTSWSGSGNLKGTFEGQLMMLILREWTVLHNRNKYFLKLLSIFTWFLKNFNGLYCLRPQHFFQRIHH